MAYGLNVTIGLGMCGLIAASCASHRPRADIPTIPQVKHVDITVDGHLADWRGLGGVFEVDRFHAPWDGTPRGTTRFRAIADSAWLYFNFEVADSLVICSPFTQELDVASGDRVEVFLSGDSTLSNYYCIEISPYGHILDYQAAHYRRFDESWDLAGLEVGTQLVDGGYAVEGRLPLAFLYGLPGRPRTADLKLWMGLYRAEYNKAPTEKEPVQWITWINPATEEPDFHVPSSFVKLQIHTPK